MAIVRTRDLEALVSVFNQQSIEFTVPTGATAVLVTLTWDTSVTAVFTPLRTSTNVGGRDTYFLDLSDVLKYCLGFPTADIDDNLGIKLSKALNIKIDTNADTANYNITLCFGYDQFDLVHTLMTDVYVYGTRGIIYHNGSIVFYFAGAAGDYTTTIGGVSKDYSLVTGYNYVVLHSSQWMDGNWTIATTTTILGLVYRLAANSNTLTWMDKNGALSRWTFRQLSVENESSKIGDIPIYYQTQALTTEKSIESGRNKSLKYELDTIAINDTHYQLLTEIQDSMYITYNDVRVKVSDSNSRVGTCKQNLNFKITLIQEAYAPNF